MRIVVALNLLLLFIGVNTVSAWPSVGEVKDKRFESVRGTNTKYGVSELSLQFKTASERRRRAAELREQVRGAAGLLPAPEKAPLNARVFHRTDSGDYTVENVYFESIPGLYVCGNLYRPKGKGPFPAVLNPHGHWSDGRFSNREDVSIPGRCINFAKQGYVAFSYDMIGFGESVQLLDEGDRHHRISGIQSRKNKIWGISLGGLQTWNSIRALDYLLSLPYVDKKRIACTGASGGGTQTFLLCAADQRVKVSAPVNMVSASMQGGCSCENLPNLRIDTNNVEITSVMAPNPMLLVSCTGDWTKDTPKVEFPAVQAIYSLLGEKERVSYVQIDTGHNYNKDSREAVYSWLSRWFRKTPQSQVITEQPFQIESVKEMYCFPDGKMPDGLLDREGVLSSLMAEAKAQLIKSKPEDLPDLKRFRKLYQPALRSALSIQKNRDVGFEDRGIEAFGDFTASKLVITEKSRGAVVPALLLVPKSIKKSEVVLIVHENGKASLFPEGKPDQLVRSLMNQGLMVLAIDCFGIGDSKHPENAPVRDVDKNFFDTYNRTDTAERVSDILTAIDYLAKRKDTSAVHLVGIGKGGLWSLLARPFSHKIGKTVVDVCGIDLSDDQPFIDDFYVPCIRRAGDFRAAVALTAPGDLFIHNARGKFDLDWALAAYAASGKPEAFTFQHRVASDVEIVNRLIIRS